MADYVGTRGNDLRAGKAGNDTFDMRAGGDDTVLGNAGNDTIQMGATLNASDHLSGGDGSDLLELNGDYSAGLILNAQNFDSIETLRLDAGHDYSIGVAALADFSVTSHQGALIVYAETLKVGDDARIDCSVITATPVVFHGGAGNDYVAGTSMDDYFYMALGDYSTHTGGDDTIIGGAGDDWIEFGNGKGAGLVDGGDGDDQVLGYDEVGTLLTKGMDTIQGGAGYDTIDLTIYTAKPINILLTAANFGGFEDVVISGRVSVKLSDDAVTSVGHDGYFDISAVGVDASAETDVGIHFTSFTGAASFKGGAKADLIDMSAADHVTALGGAGDDVVTVHSSNFNTGDHVTGGAGYDRLILSGVDHADLSSANGSGFEDFHTTEGLTFGAGAIVGANLITVETNDVSGGQLLDASAMRSVSFDMSSTGPGDTLLGGGDADTLAASGDMAVLQGKAGADVLLAEGVDATLTGGAGADRFVFSDSDTYRQERITDLSKIDTVDISAIDADTTRAGDQAFHIVAAFTAHAGEMTVTYDAQNDVTTYAMDNDGDKLIDYDVYVDGNTTGFAHFVL